MGQIVYANRTTVNVTGYARNELIDRNVKLIVPDALAAMHHKFIENYISTGNARLVGTGRDVLVKDKHGQHVHCYAFLSEVRRETQLFFVAQLDLYNLVENST